MTAPVAYENESQGGEELAASAAAFATGVDLAVVRQVLDAAAEQQRRGRLPAPGGARAARGPAGAGRGHPAWQVLTEQAEEPRETAQG